jgi:hypothetical protein
MSIWDSRSTFERRRPASSRTHRRFTCLSYDPANTITSWQGHEKIANVVSICVQLICIVLGTAIILFAVLLAIFAASAPQGEPFTQAWKIFSSLIAAGGVLSAGYWMFAFGWRRPFAGRGYRTANFALLLIPFGACVLAVNSCCVLFLPAWIAVVLAVFTLYLMLLCASQVGLVLRIRVC